MLYENLIREIIALQKIEKGKPISSPYAKGKWKCVRALLKMEIQTTPKGNDNYENCKTVRHHL